MHLRLRSIQGPLLALSLTLTSPLAQAIEGAESVESTVTLRVEGDARDGMTFARRIEVHARGARPLVRESDAEAGTMLARMSRVWPISNGRAVVAGEAVLGEGTRTLQVWLISVQDGEVRLLDELSLTVARTAPVGGVVQTRGRVRVMIPAPTASRSEIEEWELTIHEEETDREHMRFRPLVHGREGVRAGRRIAWVDLDLARGRFVTRGSHRR